MTKDKRLQPINRKSADPDRASEPSYIRGEGGMEPKAPATPIPLSQWINHSLNQKDTKITHRIRGNILHILCEARECPPMEATLQKIKTALDEAHSHTLPLELSTASPSPIYQILLYGRKQGNKHPDWSLRIDPPSPLSSPLSSPSPLSLRVREAPGEGLRGQGEPGAIARHLGEILSPFGVSVRIQIKPLKTPTPATSPPRSSLGRGDGEGGQKRLWVFCTCAYSPDPALLAEPLVQRLRHLHLENFRDAMILGLVAGETKPEWWLRVDLTPPEQQLTAWARWGDMGALTRLLGQKLTPLGLEVSGVIEASTLHLFFSKTSPPNDTVPSSFAIDKETVKACIKPVLESIAPRGIIGATLYGQLAEASPPVWVDWLDLPASRHVELAATVLERAAAFDLEAITYLVDRQLNQDIELKLLSGGIQVAVRRTVKEENIYASDSQQDAEGIDGNPKDILHILIDNPLGPPDRRYGPTLALTIANLNIRSLAGVRIYGRTCGGFKPAWRHEVDFTDQFNSAIKQAQDHAPGIAPEIKFPPTELSSPSLLLSAPQTIESSDFKGTCSSSEDLQTFLTKQLKSQPDQADAETEHWLRRLLIATKGYKCAKSSPTPETAGAAATMIWGILGLLGLVQADWFLASLARTRAASAPIASVTAPYQETGETIPQFHSADLSDEADGGAFDLSGFTKTPDFSFSYPTFNSKQLDEQLANYIRYVAEGGPADVLIVGSSRALRGIDPAALAASLNTTPNTTRPKLRIFNFGINGATAQVVEWLLQDLLAPEYLPKLILWADGARAFNSGRADRTMEAIIASPGYKALQQGNPPTIPNPHTPGEDTSSSDKPKTPKSLNLAAVYEEIDTFLASKLPIISTSYEHRRYLLELLRNSRNRKQPTQKADNTESKPLAEPATDSTSETSPQPNGFLPIPTKFDPYTYYDQYALVTGTYDADYQSFELLGKQDEALQRIIQFTSSRDITIVFINTPLTMGYLDPVRQAYEREFQQYILTLAMQHQFLFKDLSELWPTQNDYFSDPSHLNRFGAIEVARKLARDPLISWPTISK